MLMSSRFGLEHRRRRRTRAFAKCGLLVCLSLMFIAGVAPAQRRAGRTSLFLMDADGSNVTTYLVLPDFYWLGSPAWSPDGRRIVFDASPDRGGGPRCELYVTDVDDPLGTRKGLGPGNGPSWSPDGKRIAFFVREGNPAGIQAGVWMMNSDGTDRQWLSEGERPEWSPDGSKLVLSSNHEGFASLYVVQLSGRRRVLDIEYDRVIGASWSPDGQRLVFVGYRDGDSELAITSAAGSDRYFRVRWRGRVGWHPRWSPDGNQVAFFVRDLNEARILHVIHPDTEDSPVVLKNQQVAFMNSDPAWSPDGRRIAFMSDRAISDLAAPPDSTGTVQITLEEIHRFDKEGSVYDLKFMPGGDRVLIGSDPTDDRLALWNIATRTIERRIEQLGVYVDVAPDGKTAAVTDFTPSVKLVSLDAEPNIRPLAHGQLVICVAFSPDGKRLASGAMDGSVCLWDVETGEELLRFTDHEGPVSNVVFAPDGTWIVSAGQDKMLRIWNPSSGQEQMQIPNEDLIWSVAVSPDGRRILTGAGGQLYGNPLLQDVVPIEKNPVRLWDVQTGELIRELAGHSHVVRSLDFSPDGKLACSGGFDNTLRVWDLETGQELARVDSEGWVNVAKFSPDGRYILCGGGVRRVEEEWFQSPEERVRLFSVHRTGDEPESDHQ